MPIQTPTLPPPRPRQSGAKSFYRLREGAPCTLTVILKLATRWSDQHHLVLSTVGLQFQGWFVPISLRTVLETAVAFVTAVGLPR